MAEITILPTDVMFERCYDVGPECLCSRCLAPIRRGIPIRAWAEDVDGAFAFHPRCLGFEVDDDDLDEDGPCAP